MLRPKSADIVEYVLRTLYADGVLIGGSPMPLKLRSPNRKVTAAVAGWYGPTGVGKTTLLKTLRGLGQGILLEVKSTEDGDYVLADCEDFIRVVEIEQWEDLDEVFEKVASGEWACDWVAWDTITGLQVLAQRFVLREENSKRWKQTAPTLDEYGDIGAMVGNAVLKWKTLAKFIFILGQERFFKARDNQADEMAGQIGPAVLPSALAVLMPPLILMGRYGFWDTDTGKRRRGLRVFDPDFEYWCKSRTFPGRKMPDVVANPNIKALLDYMLRDGKPPKALNVI